MRAPAYLLRFPPGLREQLKAQAKANHRSRNAHTLHTLTTP